MSILRWLFGREENRYEEPRGKARGPAAVKAPEPQSKSKGKAVSVRVSGSNMLFIPEADFIGLFSTSPSGRYKIAWHDGDGNRGGARSGGDGHYLLLDGNTIVARGRMQRPNDGKVADNGTFVLNDWLFSSALAGTFWAFDGDGKTIMSVPFAANLYSNGLADDGSFAACSTCNSGNEKDSSVTAIFDLGRREEVSRFRPESGWPNAYTFFPTKRLVRLGYANLRAEATFSFVGEFVDRHKWNDARLASGDLYAVDGVFKEASRPIEDELARRLLTAVDRGLSDEKWRDPSWQAFGLRLRGEILDTLGKSLEALDAYERALALNPKIGVRRRISQLRKNLPE